MYRLPGIAAGLATAITIIATAAPARADIGPIPLPTVSIGLLDGPTTDATKADPATSATTRPTSARQTRTQPATTTKEQEVRTTHGGTQGATARQQPTSHPTPALRPAAPPTQPAAAGAGGAGDPGLHDRWFDLAEMGILAVALLMATAMIGWRRRRSDGGEPDGNREAADECPTVGILRPARPPRGDDGGFAERFLQNRRRLRHMSDT